MSVYFGSALYSGNGVYFGAPLQSGGGNTAPSVSSLTITVSENTNSGEVIGYVSASDVNGDSLFFSLTGLTNSEFTINPISGAITLNTPLNFDERSQYIFTARAFDGTAYGTATVTVNVQEAILPAPSIDALIGLVRCHPALAETNAASTIYRKNTNVVEVRGLKYSVSREFASSAVIGITLKDLDGQTIAGATFPITLAAFGNGLYYGTLPHTLDLDDDEEVVAEISAASGQSVGFWLENITVIDREA